MLQDANRAQNENKNKDQFADAEEGDASTQTQPKAITEDALPPPLGETAKRKRSSDRLVHRYPVGGPHLLKYL